MPGSREARLCSRSRQKPSRSESDAAILLYNGGPDEHSDRSRARPVRCDRTSIPAAAGMGQAARVRGRLHGLCTRAGPVRFHDDRRFGSARAAYRAIQMQSRDSWKLTRAAVSQAAATPFTLRPHCRSGAGCMARTRPMETAAPAVCKRRVTVCTLDVLAINDHHARLRRSPCSPVQGKRRPAGTSESKQTLGHRGDTVSTLAALLGFEVHRSPATYEYVRYRERYSPGHVDLAFHRSDAYWIHPVNRDIHDPLRRRVGRSSGTTSG